MDGHKDLALEKYEVCKNIFPSAQMSNSRETVKAVMVCNPGGSHVPLLSSVKKIIYRLRKDP